MPSPLFDDSLPDLVRLLREHRSDAFVESGTALRDGSGRLSFFSSRLAETDAERETLSQAVKEKLGPYARNDRTIVFADEVGASLVLNSEKRIPIEIDGIFCQLLDRRIVGAGWLESPTPALLLPPRIVFATLKGGVGRSTALVVAAADLARRNQNVLVVDLDLEAPGLGGMMLSPSRIPELGAVDFLVENGIGGVADAMLSSFIGTSDLTEAGGGRVDVVPAFGRRSALNPENVLPKLSRAMIEDIVDQDSISVGDQISSMIDRIAQIGSYDVVLIDSRAGVSELAAPAVIGLGATVLFFGTAQQQTIEGYRSLFSALQLLAQRDRGNGRDAEWRLSLRPVYAKSSMSADVGQQFLDDFYDLYSAHLYDAESLAETDSNALRFSRDDQDAPHWPLTIAFNQSLVDFDPGRKPSQLGQTFYEQTFRPFLNSLDEIIQRTRTNASPP